MKKRIRFQFEGNTYIVDVEREGNILTLEREGAVYQVTLLPEEKLQIPAGRQAAQQAARPEAVPREPSVYQATQAVSAPVTAPQVSVTKQIDSGAGNLAAPITGVIKELKAASGRRVEKGQIVLVMEAMKMDIDVYAPVSGVINEVMVRRGENVRANQLLLTIS